MIQLVYQKEEKKNKERKRRRKYYEPIKERFIEKRE